MNIALELGPRLFVVALAVYTVVAVLLALVVAALWHRALRVPREIAPREAARRLDMRRTTLAYQEQRIARLLRRFVMRSEEPR